jgi:electron transfer flavoprotein alpha subunit
MNVLVFADNTNGHIAKAAFEAVSFGSKVASDSGGKSSIVTFGNPSNDALNELAAYGTSDIRVLRSLSTMDPQQCASLIKAACEETGAELVVFCHDYTGKSVAAMVAAKLGAGMVSGVIDYPETGNGFTVKKAVFSGKAFAQVKINSNKKVISLLPNSVAKTKGSTTANIIEFNTEVGAPSVTIKEFKIKGGDGINLTEAELVVSAGRGLKGPENWGMIEDLAKELGAATACSRPVADIGWRPHHEHVGQTGVAIRPNLYIAAGISGAIQHLAGVNGSKVIVVINTDPEAPFFKAADYGIVGDAFEVVPKLVEAVKAFKANQA